MKNDLYELMENLAPIMLGEPVPAFARDAWAGLIQWKDSGERIHEITQDDMKRASSGLAPELSTGRALIRTQAVAYLWPDGSTWILVSRHAAGAPYRCPGAHWCHYDHPTLTYATLLEGLLSSGSINLDDHPTAADLKFTPEMGELRSVLPLFFEAV